MLSNGAGLVGIDKDVASAIFRGWRLSFTPSVKIAGRTSFFHGATSAGFDEVFAVGNGPAYIQVGILVLEVLYLLHYRGLSCTQYITRNPGACNSVLEIHLRCSLSCAVLLAARSSYPLHSLIVNLAREDISVAYGALEEKSQNRQTAQLHRDAIPSVHPSTTLASSTRRLG